MADSDVEPLLIPLTARQSLITIDRDEFVIGRAKNASYDIKHVGISRNHCIFLKQSGWKICDKSSAGTWLNNNRIESNVNTKIVDGDLLELGVSHEFIYVFCSGGYSCPKSCLSRGRKVGKGLNAELDQRRRIFEYNASLERSGIEESILEKQRNTKVLEQERKQLNHKYSVQLTHLNHRIQQQQEELIAKGSISGTALQEAQSRLEQQFKDEKVKLEEIHVKETNLLTEKIAASQAAEVDLKKQNELLLQRLETEKSQFEKRLEEERLVMETKLAEQLVEQERLASEKNAIEEELRLRIVNLEQVAHQGEEQLQQKQAEFDLQRKKEEERLSKEKDELEQRLKDLESKLQEKERQDKEKEKEREQRDLEMQEQERQREEERRKREEEFRARELELQEREKEKERELQKREEEAAKELQEREAELQRRAEERERELQEQQAREHQRLEEELRQREARMREQLGNEIFKLQEEKVAIEQNIRGELNKKEGENAEILNKLRSELDLVKRDLATTSTKRTLLEKELEDAGRAKEAASQSNLQARKDVIDNFGDIVETELQCSICNELFVMATTLNCNHTFCHACISNWLSKKKDCPICRAPTTQTNRSIVLDSFIDKMVENLSEELKTRRKNIVDERKALLEAQPSAAKKRKTGDTGRATVAVPNQLPLQVISNLSHLTRFITDGQGQILRVVAVQGGANTIQIPQTTAANRSVLTGPSTSQTVTVRAPAPTPQGLPLPRAGPQAMRPQQQQPPQRPYLVPQSSSARTPTPMRAGTTPAPRPGPAPAHQGHPVRHPYPQPGPRPGAAAHGRGGGPVYQYQYPAPAQPRPPAARPARPAAPYPAPGQPTPMQTYPAPGRGFRPPGVTVPVPAPQPHASRAPTPRHNQNHARR